MQCVIPKNYIKLFAKSVQCLAKIGEDLYIEAIRKKIVFRTLNSSRVAFFAFFLDEKFFEDYSLEDNIERKFAVKLKSCQAVFRQFDTVERCIFRLDEIQERVIFELICKHGIRKVYKLTYEVIEPIQALYNKDNAVNSMIFAPRKLMECVGNFQTQVEEISLSVSKDSILLQSFADEAAPKTKAKLQELKTRLTLDVGDFESYDISLPTCLTFCLKEFKAILTFCDAAGQSISMNFEKSGRPVLLSVKYFGVFEADFVLATLLDNSSQQSTDDSQHSEHKGSYSTNDSNVVTPTSNKNTARSDVATPRSSARSGYRSEDNNNNYTASPASTPSNYGFQGSNTFISSGGTSTPSNITSGSQGQYYDQNTKYDDNYNDDYEVPASPPREERATKMARTSSSTTRQNMFTPPQNYSSNYSSIPPTEPRQDFTFDDEDEEIPASPPRR